MDNDLGLCLVLLALSMLTHTAAYQVGKRLEAKTWKKAVQIETVNFCNECFDLGAQSVVCQ